MNIFLIFPSFYFSQFCSLGLKLLPMTSSSMTTSLVVKTYTFFYSGSPFFIFWRIFKVFCCFLFGFFLMIFFFCSHTHNQLPYISVLPEHSNSLSATLPTRLLFCYVSVFLYNICFNDYFGFFHPINLVFKYKPGI